MSYKPIYIFVALHLLGIGLMTMYRLYTEARPNLTTLVTAAGFKDATIYSATGLYNGTVENAAVIEIIAPGYSRSVMERIAALATDIATVNRQTSALVTSIPDVSISTFGAQDDAALPMAR